MERIKEERKKLVQEISNKCITACDFERVCQENKLDAKKEN